MKACKICMVGDFAVGKTSLVARYVHSRFSDAYLTTVGVKIDTRTLTVPSGEEIKLVLWDIAGKSELAGIDTNYLRDASAYLLVADTTRAETLDSVFKLQQQVERQLGAKPFSLLLNKSDLVAKDALADVADRLEQFVPAESQGQTVDAALPLAQLGIIITQM